MCPARKAPGCQKRLAIRCLSSLVSPGFAAKVGVPSEDHNKLSVMPQRGYALQPRVVASATLGNESILSSTATRLRLLCEFLSDVHLSLRKRRNRDAVEISFLTVPRVAETATLG